MAKDKPEELKNAPWWRTDSDEQLTNAEKLLNQAADKAKGK